MLATYTALAELATQLTGYPGRKGVVWITHGVPLHGMSPNGTPVDYLPVLKKLAAMLGQAQIVLYPVDQTTRPNVSKSDTSADTLQQFASITGGRLYPNGNIEKAIGGALSDNAASYLLAYPIARHETGRQVSHHPRDLYRPGVRIQAQQGYFAAR